MTVDEFIQAAIKEDIGDGDHTSLSTIPADAKGKARLLVKQEGILAGVDIALKVFEHVDPELEIDVQITDGSEIKYGDEAFYVSGSSRSIVIAERLALNIMQRMSGIATHTGELVKLVEGTNAKILDTRKTTPNFRYFEKLAVKIGGGHNHRMGLYDRVMIKDNHIDFAGGIRSAINKVIAYLEQKNKDIPIEVEARNMEEIQEIMDVGGIHRILIDNFTPIQTKDAVHLINGMFETESSGGITKENIRDYAETGVDFISIGALTHQIKSLDLSLKAMK
ncbi:MAG: carboxylating nicotinate-nucleotide diphosphorylase [Flavobacteriales bacterium]|nr:carboxylating nicotinate-nucleotide diphosphorylase [Flavobacteriales bacterium]